MQRNLLRSVCYIAAYITKTWFKCMVVEEVEDSCIAV